jgi:predicted nucleic acid-binding protein
MCSLAHLSVSIRIHTGDNFLLSMAQAAGADILVSGDKAGLLKLGGHRKTRIVSVADFVAELDLK